MNIEVLKFVIKLLIVGVLAYALYLGFLGLMVVSVVLMERQSLSDTSAHSEIRALEMARAVPPQELGLAPFSADLKALCGQAKWFDADDLAKLARCIARAEARQLCRAQDRHSLRLLFGSYFERLDPRPPDRVELVHRMLADDAGYVASKTDHVAITNAYVSLVRRGVIPKADAGPGAPREIKTLVVQEISCTNDPLNQ